MSERRVLRAMAGGGAASWAAAILFVLGVADGAAAPQLVSPGPANSLNHGVGSLRGVVRAPWAVDDADSVVAVFVEGAVYEPMRPDPTVDQADLTFVPHVLPVTVGTSVRFRNSDIVLHNVFSPSAAVTAFDLGTYAVTGERSVVFDVPGEVVVLCNVHPQMSAFVLVLETSFWAVTDEAGSYSLQGIPVGTHRVRVWNQVAEPFEGEVTITTGGETRGDFVFASRRRGGWIRQRGSLSPTAGIRGVQRQPPRGPRPTRTWEEAP